MRPLPRAAKPLLLVFLLLAPHAAAHGGYDAGAPLGDGSVHLRIVGAPVLAARTPLSMEAVTDLLLPIDARLVEPAGAPGAWFPLASEGQIRRADVSFAEAGDWRVELRAGPDVAAFDVPVWPAGPTFVEAAGEAASRGVVVQGSDEALALRLVDADHRPIAPPADARAVIGAASHPLVARDGLLVLEREWRELGAHEIEVVSEEARLAQGTRPPVHMLVVPPDEADVYGIGERDVAWGLLAVPALLAAALLARRVTKGPP